MPRHKTIADQLTGAILQAERKGTTRYQLAKAAGVWQSQLTRLLAGEDKPRLDTAERIAEALGYRIVLKREK